MGVVLYIFTYIMNVLEHANISLLQGDFMGKLQKLSHQGQKDKMHLSRGNVYEFKVHIYRH